MAFLVNSNLIGYNEKCALMLFAGFKYYNKTVSSNKKLIFKNTDNKPCTAKNCTLNLVFPRVLLASVSNISWGNTVRIPLILRWVF